jgi:hypothetical protein
VRLERLLVLLQVGRLHLRDKPLVGQVGALDLDLDRLLVEEVVHFLLGVVADRLVRVEDAGQAEDAPVPAVGGVARDGDGALGERLVPVEQLVEIDFVDRSPTLASGAPPGGLVEAVVERRSGARHTEAAEEDPQHRVGVGGGAHRGPGICAHPFLVDHDRGGQPLEQVHVRAAQARHEALDEGAIRLVDQPLRLGGDGGVDEGTLAGARDAGEDRQPALGDLHAHVLQVVLAGTVHPDKIV